MITNGWVEVANCATTDPEIMFPNRGDSSVAGKKVCANCGVPEQCLAEALTEERQFGIRGGMSAYERKTIIKKGRQNGRVTSDFGRINGDSPAVSGAGLSVTPSPAKATGATK